MVFIQNVNKRLKVKVIILLAITLNISRLENLMSTDDIMVFVFKKPIHYFIQTKE